jgi:hypothetical protein
MRHQDRQLQEGLALVWEVERALQGSQEAPWAILNHIRVREGPKRFLNA